MLVPQLRFGVLTGDPANAMFTAANFPGASAANITAASQPVRAADRTHQPDRRRRPHQRGHRRVRVGGHRQAERPPARERRLPAGLVARQVEPVGERRPALRHPVPVPGAQQPLLATPPSPTCAASPARSRDNSCNLFQPGVDARHQADLQATASAGTHTYNTDYNNIAPSVGFAWTPAQRSGVLGTLMGADGDFVVRGGFTRSFSRSGLNDFTEHLQRQPRHPHRRQPSTKRTGNLGAVPLLLRDTARLTPPAFAKQAGVSDDRRDHAGRQHHRSQHPGAERRLPVARHPAQRQQEHGARSALRRHARPRFVAHAGRTATTANDANAPAR